MSALKCCVSLEYINCYNENVHSYYEMHALCSLCLLLCSVCFITGTEEFRVLDLKQKKTPVRRKNRRKQEVMLPR
jgi:hypothetical protein